MPNNGKLAIGAGIAQGVESFIKSFYAAQNAGFQKRQQKNQIAIQALLSQLNDDTTPASQRGTIVDEIQRLTNNGKPVKDDERLSLHLGLTPDSPLMQEQIDTGQTQQKTIGGDVNPQILNEPSPTMQTTTPIAKKRGELSPFDFKVIQNRFAQKDEEARQTRVAQIQSDIAEKSYRKLGFEPIDRGKDSQGNRYLISQNKANDVKILNLNTMKEVNSLPQDFISERENIAQNRAANLPASVKVYEENYLNQTNPDTGVNYTPAEAHVLAVRDYSDYIKSQGTARTLQNTSLGQQTGQLPPSPKMQSEEDSKKETEVNDILGKYRNAYADYTQVSSLLPNIQKRKDAAFEAKNRAQEAYNQIHAQEYDSTDEKQVAEIQRVDKELEDKRKEADDLQSQFDELVAKGTRAKAEMSAIADQARKSRYSSEFNVNQQGDIFTVDRNQFSSADRNADGISPTNPNTVRDKADEIIARPEVRAVIDAYKKANPKSKLTDRDWYRVAIRHGKIKVSQ